MAFVPLALPPLPRSLIPREVAPPPERPSPPTTEGEVEEVAESMEVEETVDEPSHELVVEDARVAERRTPSEIAVDLVDASDTAVVVSAYLPDAPPTAELLNNTMSVRQLKDRCTELGLNTVGRKMELAERIAAVQ